MDPVLENNNTKKKLIILIILTSLLAVFILTAAMFNFFNTGKSSDEEITPAPTTYNVNQNRPSPAPMIQTETGTKITPEEKIEIDKMVYASEGPYFTKEDIAVSGYYKIDDWAIVSTEPKRPVTDSANAILKKINGKWTIFIESSTDFDEEWLRSQGVPDNVIKKALIIPISIINEL